MNFCFNYAYRTHGTDMVFIANFTVELLKILLGLCSNLCHQEHDPFSVPIGPSPSTITILNLIHCLQLSVNESVSPMN